MGKIPLNILCAKVQRISDISKENWGKLRKIAIICTCVHENDSIFVNLHSKERLERFGFSQRLRKSRLSEFQYAAYSFVYEHTHSECITHIPTDSHQSFIVTQRAKVVLTALTQSHAGCALLFLHAPASWRKIRRSVLALGVEMITDEVSGESSKALMEARLQYVTCEKSQSSKN